MHSVLHLYNNNIQIIEFQVERKGRVFIEIRELVADQDYVFIREI